MNSVDILKAEKYLTNKCPIMKDIINNRSVKLNNQVDHYSSLVKAIVGQQLSVKAARSIYMRVEAHFGKPLSAINMYNASQEEFRSLGISQQKFKYLHDLSDNYLNNEEVFRGLEDLEDKIVIEKLTHIKGIGLWTSQMFLIFTLYREDIFPINDLGIQNAMKLHFSLNNYNNKNLLIQISKIAERWKPYRSIAALHLWRSLDNE